MKVLITGATGFVGRRTCEILAQAGHELVALSRDPESAKRSVAQLSAAHAWDPIVGLMPKAAFDGVDAVVHLAGESVVGRWSDKKRKAIRDSRVVGTRNLVESIAAADERPAVLVSASAIGYYGERADEVLTETSGAGDDFLADVCRSWEREAGRAGELGLHVVSLRIGVVLGDGGGALQAMLPPFKLGVGGPLGSGKQWWSWIHRDDLAGIICFILEGEALEGAVNATSPEPMRQKEFGKVLGKVLRRPAFMPTPAFALKIVLGGFSAELLSSKRVMPARLQEAGYEFLYPTLEPALREALS